MAVFLHTRAGGPGRHLERRGHRVPPFKRSLSGSSRLLYRGINESSSTCVAQELSQDGDSVRRWWPERGGQPQCKHSQPERTIGPFQPVLRVEACPERSRRALVSVRSLGGTLPGRRDPEQQPPHHLDSQFGKNHKVTKGHALS
jgi:hypothetical protein